jgi:hypothetical protein
MTICLPLRRVPERFATFGRNSSDIGQAKTAFNNGGLPIREIRRPAWACDPKRQ